MSTANVITQPPPVAELPADPTVDGSPRPARWAYTAALSGALGLCLVAGAFALSRMGRADHLPSALFWAGLVTIVLPIAWRLLSDATPRRDRILLVALTALLTYAVKVLHDPIMFALSDEFVHLAAAQRLLDTGGLFQPASISGSGPASGFPGLHAATASLSAITGLPLFSSGLIVIGAARLMMLMALFYLFERVSESSRIAGIGALLYAATPNFLFWSGQFSYQSLALPLFVVALLIVIRRPGAQPRQQIALTLTATVVSAAVVVSHHLTAYVFAGTLWLLSAMSLRRRWRQSRVFVLALVTTVAAALWFLFVAEGTDSYLSYIFDKTYDAIGGVSQRGAHKPFETRSGYRPPIPEQLVAFGSVALVFGGVLWSLIQMVRRRRLRSAPIILFSLGALGYLLMSPLRLFPGAWETANRAQELLFVGVALLLAFAVMQVVANARRPRVTRAVLCAGVAMVICGGVIQGWPGPLRLSQPLEVRVGDATIRPEGLEVATWAVRHLPGNTVYVGDAATGRELSTSGAKFAFTGTADGVPQLLYQKTLPDWQYDFLVNDKIDFAVVDRRRVSSDNLAGYFFRRRDDPDGGYGYYPPGVRRKFERLPRSSLVTDSGNIVLYDLRGLRGRPPPCPDLGELSNAKGITCRAGSRAVTVAGKDRIAELPGFRTRALGGTQVEPSGLGMQVTVRVQVQNLGKTTYRPDADWRHFFLSVRGKRTYRLKRVRYRPDNLDGARPLAPLEKREGSLNFRLRGRNAMRFLAGAGQLVIRPPSPQRLFDFDRLGVILVARPPPGQARTALAHILRCRRGLRSGAPAGGGRTC